MRSSGATCQRIRLPTTNEISSWKARLRASISATLTCVELAWKAMAWQRLATFAGSKLEDVVGDAAQVLRRRAGDAVLLGERAAELFLGQRLDLEQAGSEASAEDLLIAQGAQELFARDLATLLEKLTQAGWSSAQLDP